MAGKWYKLALDGEGSFEENEYAEYSEESNCYASRIPHFGGWGEGRGVNYEYTPRFQLRDPVIPDITTDRLIEILSCSSITDLT